MNIAIHPYVCDPGVAVARDAGRVRVGSPRARRRDRRRDGRCRGGRWRKPVFGKINNIEFFLSLTVRQKLANSFGPITNRQKSVRLAQS